MVRRLYTLAIPASAVLSGGGRQQRQTTNRGTLQEDVAPVSSTGVDAGAESLRVTYRGLHAREMAAEVVELAMANGYDAVPLFDTSSSTATAGYYVVDRAVDEPVTPQTDALRTADLDLTRQGTRHSHWRAVEATDDNGTQVTNPWGSQTSAEIGVPAPATKVRWVDDTGAVSEASPVATRTGQHGDIDVYELLDAPDGYTRLSYDVGYGDIGKIDPVAWDDHGYGSKTDANGVVQWSKAFRTDHDFVGKPILENSLVRLTFEESTNTLTVEQWDTSTSSWSAVSLGSSNWELFDADLREVTPTHVAAAVEFRDPSQSPTAYYTLPMLLHRGWEWPQWYRPDGASSVPSGLVTLLDPAASAKVIDPDATQTLLKRSEVQLG